MLTLIPPSLLMRIAQVPPHDAPPPQVVFSRPVIALGSDFMGGSAEHLVGGRGSPGW